MALFQSGKSGLLLPGTPRPTDQRNIAVPDGLVRYWPMDVDALKSSTVTADLTGTADGTVTGAVTWVAGQIGMGYSFTNTNGIFIGTSVNAGLTKTSRFSISCWIFPTSTVTNMICGTATNVSPFDGIFFIGSNNLQASIVDTATVQIKQASNGTFAINVWHHAALTYDGSNAPAGILLYLDGEKLATTATGTSVTGSFTDRPWRIGNANDAGATSPFNGTLDDARIYNRTLSASEVREIYVNGLQGSRDQAALATEIGGWPDDTVTFDNPTLRAQILL